MYLIINIFKIEIMTKKKLVGLIAVVAFALTIALNVSFSANNYNLSDISLANIEALAQIEAGTCENYDPGFCLPIFIGYPCCWDVTGTWYWDW